VPALPPGQVYVGIAAGYRITAARIAPVASYTTFASGCPGSLGVASLSAAGSLQPGNSLTVTIDHLPQNSAIVMTGFDGASSALGPLPIDLGPFGMPNCFANVSPSTALAVFGSGNAAQFVLTVPNAPQLVGITIRQQALVPDQASLSAAAAVVSDAARATVGA
jgi:hypothetical protein